MPRAGRREALPLYVDWDRFRVILGVNASHTILSHQLWSNVVHKMTSPSASSCTSSQLNCHRKSQAFTIKISLTWGLHFQQQPVCFSQVMKVTVRNRLLVRIWRHSVLAARSFSEHSAIPGNVILLIHVLAVLINSTSYLSFSSILSSSVVRVVLSIFPLQV